ncbi:MAG: UDP-N-acetylmuramate--L-alanine ligase [Acidimicrobiales bacterium mtb01]|nr:UDP-N-acetylmuramate--L-alanine ligase [Actinomycetota bacterium]TEX45004.1 MAG: UDP-N-acetylmuramate--L-alanine ligase [Acidimicrobiales bacterium mtb01]
MTEFDLSATRRIHVVGVGGPGMSALAIVLAQMGHRVSGSDVRETAVLDKVRAAGVAVTIGHDPGLVSGCDAVTYSTAIPLDNVEVRAARELGLRLMHRSGMLAAVCARSEALGVAGTHGKTTTSSLLRAALSSLSPSFVIGGDVIDLGTGAAWTGGRHIVVEADESDGTYRELPLRGAIVTNIDVDHLDHFGTFADLQRDFAAFMAGVDGPVAVGWDDGIARGVASVADPRRLVTYGADPSCTVRWTDVDARGDAMTFTVHGGFGRRSVRLPLRGIHNVANACGALALATEIGVDIDEAIRGIESFGGVGRRFDVVGRADGATFVDDYAHLPREIAAVLAAARAGGEWKRVVAVFQPNRYNRMATMADEYGDAFVDADVVVLTDIYSSGTAPIPGVTGHLVVDAVRRNHPAARVEWVADRADLARAVSTLVEPGDVCISMGCGDIEFLPREILGVRGAL